MGKKMNEWMFTFKLHFKSLETGQPNMTWENIYLNSLIYSTNIYVCYLFIIKKMNMIMNIFHLETLKKMPLI